MTRVLVTGGSGLLGHALCGHLKSQSVDVICHGYTRGGDIIGDLRDAEFVRRMIAGISPDVVVNLVAFADIDRCEEQPRNAFQTNVKTLEHITRVLDGHQSTRLIHISTDQVYDDPGPHVEEDVAPCNIYAYSKFCADQVALAAGGTVLRTNFFGPGLAHRKSFSDWLIEALAQRQPLKLLTDVIFTPLHIATLSRMIEQVIQAPVAGVFNLGSRGGMSKRDFAHALARHLGYDAGHAEETTAAAMFLKVRRARDMRMDVARFEETYMTRLPDLLSEISLLERLNESSPAH